MRKLLKTNKGCPISSLYLEIGQTPARFEIMKMRLLYLKYILEQPETSNVLQMLRMQLKIPSSGDWASTCVKNLEYLDLKISFEEIKKLPKKTFKNMIKERINQVSLEYLIEKRGKKGREIEYSCLEMSEYLLPFNSNLTTEEKCEIFAVRNRMVNIPFNFSSNCEYKCECGEKEDMNHIYQCDLYCKEEDRPIMPYEQIFNGNMKQQIYVYKKFKQNLEKREQLKTTSNPCDSFSPLLCSKG